MSISRKPNINLRDYARAMEKEATFAEARADLLGRAAQKVEQNGDLDQAKAMRHTCRKMRVQALLGRSRAIAAEIKARGDQ